MARETYTEVTPETARALKDYVGAIAREWQKSETYVYAILAGQSSDPFLKFRKMFRAVARKNREGARGFLAALNRVFVDESPEQRPTGEHALDAAYHNLKAVRAAREDGRATPEEVEAARNHLAETLARLDMPERVKDMQMRV
jgi:hypothetical protein